MDMMSDTKLAAWRAFLEAHSKVLRALEREMQEEQHLPLPCFDVLAWLSHAPDGRLRMQALADSIYLSYSGLTRLLDRMAEAGLVERQICLDDRRGWYAVITAKGREAFARAIPGHARAIQEHFLGRFSEDDTKVLHRLLSRVAEAPKLSSDKIPQQSLSTEDKQ